MMFVKGRQVDFDTVVLDLGLPVSAIVLSILYSRLQPTRPQDITCRYNDGANNLSVSHSLEVLS